MQADVRQRKQKGKRWWLASESLRSFTCKMLLNRNFKAREIKSGCCHGLFYDSSKSLGITDRDIGQHFAIDGDFSLFHPIDEPAVRGAVLPGCCIDADDPQTA
jgi:hypothetical protein